MSLPRARLAFGIASLALLTWFVGFVVWAREEARSSQCVCHLAQLQLALSNYESTYGHLPPAAISDGEGKPLLSWRVALLPFIEEDALYKQIKLDEAWDGPNNRKLHARRPSNFACPSHHDDAAKESTSYVVVVGPKTLFPGGGKARKRSDIRDDPASTLMVVETISNINWMEPRDLEWDHMSFQLNDHSSPSIASDHHSGSYPGPHVIAAEGKAYPDNQVTAYLPESMGPETIKALLIIDDSEKVVLRRGPKLD